MNVFQRRYHLGIKPSDQARLPALSIEAPKFSRTMPMKKTISEKRYSSTLLKVIIAAFVVALMGFLLALSGGPNADTLRGKIGGAAVIVAICVAIILVPIAFIINARLMSRESRRRRTENHDRIRDLLAESQQPERARSHTHVAKEANPTNRAG